MRKASLVILLVGVAAALVPLADAAPPTSTATRGSVIHYRFVHQPVLTYGDKHYFIVWRLNHDLPRAKTRRVRAKALLNGIQSQAISGGGRLTNCFATDYEGELGKPRFGARYRFEVQDIHGNTVSTVIRLRHPTKGHSPRDPARDPKARALHCTGPVS